MKFGNDLRIRQREAMVNSQLRTNRVKDFRLLDAFQKIPRQRYVDEPQEGFAYIDEDLVLAGKRVLLEPATLARLLEAADLNKEDVVLEVAAGSGFASSVIAQIVKSVFAVDDCPELLERGRSVCEELGLENIVFQEGPPQLGLAKHAPYNLILISGAVEVIPQPIFDQLDPGNGRLLALESFFSSPDGEQSQVRAVAWYKLGDNLSKRILFDCSAPIIEGFRKKKGFQFPGAVREN